MNKKYIIALDQGTTSSRAIIFDHDSNIVAQAKHEFEQIFPKPGWVEHDPMEIWSSQSSAIIECIERNSINPKKIAALGITNQRETIVVWNKITGKPIYNAIVWQCRRTNKACKEIINTPMQKVIQDKTGLQIDPYFSATKIKWILDNIEGAKDLANNGNLICGTIDTWLIWKLTKGESHVTDMTNASRTMLFNIHKKRWDEELIEFFDIPKQMLPKIVNSSEHINNAIISNHSIPITGVAGDQQSALFGQKCFKEGDAKNTYGTGCFLLMNTGKKPLESKYGLIATLAIDKNLEYSYALEGSVFMAGATIQWLRDKLGILIDENDSEYFATKVDSNEGVFLVPAFVGLGAPYWDSNAQAAIIGITRKTNRNHIIRAALEATVYQSIDILNAMQKESGIKLKSLKVDGGAIKNKFLMQFQSDMIDKEVVVASETEVSAFGAACLAGLNVGFWESVEDIKDVSKNTQIIKPNMKESDRKKLYQGWGRAISCIINK